MEDRWITDWEPSKRFPLYTRANSGEILPNPISPLGWDLVWETGVSKGWADGCHRWGTFTPDVTDPDQPDYVLFRGYVYLNVGLIRLQGVRSPCLLKQWMQLFRNHPDVPVCSPRR